MTHEETIRTALESASQFARAPYFYRANLSGFLAAFEQGLSALNALQQERESRFWLIHFEDASMRPEAFAGPDSERWARVRLAALSDNWNVTLFRSVDDAAIGEPAASQDAAHKAGKSEGILP